MTFIPGMAAVCDVVGDLYPPVESITTTMYTAEANNIAWPVDRLPGDVALILNDAFNQSSPTASVPTKVVPAGFTELASETDFFTSPGGQIWSHRVVISMRILDGSESGNITLMNSNHEYVHLMIIRADGTIIRDVESTEWLIDWGSNPVAQAIDVTDIGEVPKLAVGYVAGYNRNFSVSPPWGTVNTLSEDMGGSLDDWHARTGWTVFNPGDALTDFSVDSNGRAILASGLMWFR